MLLPLNRKAARLVYWAAARARDQSRELTLASAREELAWLAERARLAAEHAAADAQYLQDEARREAKLAEQIERLARRDALRLRAEAGDEGALRAIVASYGVSPGALLDDDGDDDL